MHKSATLFYFTEGYNLVHDYEPGWDRIYFRDDFFTESEVKDAIVGNGTIGLNITVGNKTIVLIGVTSDMLSDWDYITYDDGSDPAYNLML